MSGEPLAAALLLAAAYCLGGLHGLLMAWTQEARMTVWAAKVHRAYLAVAEAEERGKNR